MHNVGPTGTVKRDELPTMIPSAKRELAGNKLKASAPTPSSIGLLLQSPV